MSDTMSEDESPHDCEDSERIIFERLPVDATATARAPCASINFREPLSGEAAVEVQDDGELNVFVDVERDGGRDDGFYAGVSLTLHPSDAMDLAADLLEAARHAERRQEKTHDRDANADAISGP
jgi:hypothetical protein